ncbi:LPXTG cell wall anchor domain-containing protein [Actinoplanes solisilvae]|uniref:LPXTG cell wall anchor domain-containing protein n=1 Tax=Actinoplanes solisilvae TaxID=2486853 RepID=UPI001F0CAB8E|nr:LPXTG cell wall anchor domain-containing protein [Actinoplanes solisilvae]
MPTITGKVGDTVNLNYEIVNHGPADGGGPGVTITAPTGTVLLPTEDWCWTEGTEHELKPESAVLRCNFESFFPTVASGYGILKPTVRLKIKSTPGTDGTIKVSADHGTGMESNPANNTARIVFAAGSGDSAGPGDSGGQGGSLPITGTPTGLIAGLGAGILALGLAALVVMRRRRHALPPDDAPAVVGLCRHPTAARLLRAGLSGRDGWVRHRGTPGHLLNFCRRSMRSFSAFGPA